MLTTAIDLADEGGIAALSMRKLARRLGVEAMSLYHHVAGKDDILVEIVDLVIAEIELPPQDLDWKEAVRRNAISAHDVLVRHPWASSLIMSVDARDARLRQMESILATLRKGGFSAELTHHAFHALESHIVGFTLWQVSIPIETKEELAELGTAFLRALPVDEFPYLAEHVEQHLGDSAASGAEEFEFGLDLILDGLERLRDAG